MDKANQAELVRELAARTVADLVADIEAGRIPDDWNGIQLRALLAERFARNRCGREGDRRFWRAYRNEVTIRNL